jgi:nucleotide-binding universal stress UspA family protein
MKILLAVDGSPYTKRMLSYLADRGDWLGTGHAYTVFHGVPALPPRVAAFATPEQMRGYYDADAAAVFEPIRQFLEAHGIEADYLYLPGNPAESIASLAERDGHDLLVMGSHGHGALANLLLGSVATQVMARCSTPVLLIR